MTNQLTIKRTRHCVAFLAFAIALFFFATPAKSASIVVNGSFETLVSGNTITSTYGYFCQAGATCTSNVTGWQSSCNGSCGTGATVASLITGGSGGSAFNGNIGFRKAAPNSLDGGNFVGIELGSYRGASDLRAILQGGKNHPDRCTTSPMASRSG